MSELLSISNLILNPLRYRTQKAACGGGGGGGRGGGGGGVGGGRVEVMEGRIGEEE